MGLHSGSPTSGERFGDILSEDVGLVAIQNKAAAEMIPVSAEAEHALVKQFVQITEHCMSSACAPEMLEACDGAVLMQCGEISPKRLKTNSVLSRGNSH